jgi:hypothetical protein
MSFNYDIIGFIRSLKQDAIGTVQEILVRRLTSPLISNIYNIKKEPRLIDKISLLTEKDYDFLLIMLLSARFDVFQNAIKYVDIPGEIERVVAPSEYSYIWIPRVFGKSNLKIFYPYLRVGVHDTLKIFKSLKNSILIKDDKNILLNTTLPCSINKYILRYGLYKRNIIVYAQPHFPWISDIQLSQSLYRYVAINELVPGDIIQKVLKKSQISRKRVLKAYYLDMIYVLRCISELIKYVKYNFNFDKIIITGIHGELLGDYGFYLHKNFKLPQLILVPWYEVVI